MAGNSYPLPEHILIDAIERLLQSVADDPNEWDGDEADVSIYADFLEWMPDLIKHQVAETIRDGYPAGSSARRAADQIDPFHVFPDSAGVPSWYRKRDHRLVPLRVARDPSPERIKK